MEYANDPEIQISSRIDLTYILFYHAVNWKGTDWLLKAKKKNLAIVEKGTNDKQAKFLKW